MNDNLPTGLKYVDPNNPGLGATKYNHSIAFQHTDITHNMTFDLYVPLDFSFCSSNKLLINSRFFEKLEIKISLNDYQQIISPGGVAFLQAPVLEQCELYTEIISVTPEHMQKIKQSNYSLTTLLSMLTTNWKRILQPVSVSQNRDNHINFAHATKYTTTSAFNIFQTELACGMLICVCQLRDNTQLATIGSTYNTHSANTRLAYPSTLALGGPNGTYQRITSISLTVGGRTLFTSTGDKALLLASHLSRNLQK